MAEIMHLRDANGETYDADEFYIEDEGNMQGITEETVTYWTTKDGKRWPTLEEAIRHQRRKQIIDAIYEADENNADWLARHAEQIADNAEALFFLLEPFFRDER